MDSPSGERSFLVDPTSFAERTMLYVASEIVKGVTDIEDRVVWVSSPTVQSIAFSAYRILNGS